MGIKILILPIIILLCSCNSEKNKIEKELNKYVELFHSNRNSFYEITDNMKKEHLLLGPKTLSLIDTDKFPKDLYSKMTVFGIKEIKHGRYMPCDAMTEDLREIFFHIDESIAYWYCPCMDLTEKNHYHKNKELRGYKDLINFNSIGLGGSWAIIKIIN